MAITNRVRYFNDPCLPSEKHTMAFGYFFLPVYCSFHHAEVSLLDFLANF